MKKVVALLLLLATPLLFALPVYAKTQDQNVVLNEDEVINHDYFAAGQTVTILGTVNGDAYVAGGTVLVDGTINGDLLVAGGNVTVRGTVTQDIRAAGGSVTIASDTDGNITSAGGNVTIGSDANIQGSVVLAGGNINIDSAIGRGATIAGGQATIASPVGGDIWAGTGSLTLTPQAQIDGNLHYISDNDAVILSGATIAGETTHETPPQELKDQQSRAKSVASGLGAGFKFASLLSALILGFLLVKFFPRFMESTSKTIAENPWKALGIGFITYAAFPFVFLILVITLIGIPLAFILLFSVILIAYLSKLFLALYVGTWLMKRLNWKGGTLVSILLGLVVYYVLSMIPLIGALAFMAFLFIGTGAHVLTELDYYKSLRAKNIL